MPNAQIFVTLKDGLYDPQGATVRKALHQLGHNFVQEARIGKFITLKMGDGLEVPELEHRLDLMCQQLLANPVIEDYEITFEGTLADAADNGSATAENYSTAEVSAITNRREVPRTPAGLAISEPFTLSYEQYLTLPDDEKLSVRSTAWQKKGPWIMQQLNVERSDWILVAGLEVFDRGESLDTYPDDEKQAKLGKKTNLVPWVFTRPPS